MRVLPALLSGLLAALFLPGLALARPAEAPLEYIEKVTGGADPAAALPLIIAVHGLGDRPERFVRLLADFPAPARIIAVRGPTPRGRGYSWFPIRRPITAEHPAMVGGIRDSARRLADLARQLARSRPTAGQPIITGFSQGGILSFAVALHHPDAISGAVPVAGALPTTLWSGAGRSAGRAVRIVALHGEADRVVPYVAAAALVKALEIRGLPARLKSFPGVAHRVPPPMKAAVYDALAEMLPTSAP